MGKYEELYRQSMESPDEYWAAAAEDVAWVKKWDKVLDDSRAPNFYSWFTGGELNTCYNAVDYHVDGIEVGESAPGYRIQRIAHRFPC